MSQPSPPRNEQGSPSEHVPPEEVHAQEGARKELKIWQRIPITIRSIFKLMRDVTSTAKWYPHDQFKPKNQVKEVPAQASEEAVTSKQQPAKKYQMVK